MLPVFPVYANSLCVTKSVHAGALPGPAYPTDIDGDLRPTTDGPDFAGADLIPM